jgi:alkanesulfonate monooxygenase SsuD/methylene tetrahydromethanopterin reductase-like flavin-dependent oxidoreductase (luciferase family)
MEIYTFDETTYPGIPKEIGPETIQTNRFCDPVLAAKTVREHMEEFELSEELGYDGTFINEHHFTYFSLNPSSTPLAAALIARTKKIKVGVIGHVLPLRHPVHTAEEFAQLDVLSGGRFIGGIVRGVPQEYVSYNVDPFTSRERFAESYEILQKCLTEEIFDYEGKFYNLKSVSIWPLPLQKPLPMWMPAGSADTIEFAAERHIPMARVWEPPESFQDVFNYYRKVANEKFGWNPDPTYCVGARYVHVADTNDQARAECEEAVMYVRRLSSFNRPIMIPAPLPGLNTDRAFEFRRSPKGMPGPGVPFEQLREDGYIVCGDPDYVADWLKADMESGGYGRFLSMFHVGNISHEAVMRSKRLFAEHVMPRLRPINTTEAQAINEAEAPIRIASSAIEATSLISADTNYQLTRESPELVGEFVDRSDGFVIAGWELRLADSAADGAPYRIILVGSDNRHEGHMLRLVMIDQSGQVVTPESDVSVEIRQPSGEHQVLLNEKYATASAGVRLQQRAELGESATIHVLVAVPVGTPEPDPTAFDSAFELDCVKLWWFETA